MVEYLTNWLASAGGIAPIHYWVVDDPSESERGELVAVDATGIVVVKRGTKETCIAIPWAGLLRVIAEL